jgi:hypothetical protein
MYGIRQNMPMGYGNEDLGSIKSGCTTGGLSSSAQIHRISDANA